MKYIKILSFAAIVSLAFACQKQEYPAFEYGPEDVMEGKTEVYFPTTFVNVEMEPTTETFEVTVARTVSTGALSVPITVFDPAGVFDVPATVDFAAGEEEAVLTVGVTRMELETDYEFTLYIPADYYYAYKADSEASTKISFHFAGLKQKWNDAGTCTFYDWTWWEDVVSVDNIAIQNHEGTNDYRIVAPYAAISPEEFAPANILFTVKDNEVNFKKGISDFWPGSGCYFYWDTTNYGAYCNIEPYEQNADGSIYVGVNFLLAVGTTPSYICWFGFDWTGGPLVIEEEEAE